MTWHTKWTTSYWPLGDYTSQAVLDNATEVYNRMKANGWTHNAACGAIGNLCAESTGINAGQWQGGFGGYYKSNQGFGMAQWTPWNRVSAYVGSQSQTKMMNPDSQLTMLLSQSNQWSTGLINSSGYSSYYGITVPYFATFADYAKGNASVNDMTAAYMCCWERPANADSLSTRQKYANYFNEKLGDGPVTGEYYVTVVVEGNGKAWAKPTSGKEGDRIILYFNEVGSDTFEDWEVISGGVTVENNAFILGNSDVVIKAHFTGESPEPVKTYRITVEVVGNGVAFALPSIAEEGTTVTLIATPMNSKNKFRYWSANGIDFSDKKLSPTTFTMPAHDVTITAYFKKASSICYMLRPTYIRG